MSFFLSRIRQTALIVVVALIVSLGFAATSLANALSQKLEAAQNRIADLERRLAKSEQMGPSLADAMLLVPPDSVVTGGARLTSQYYWVSAETVDKDGKPAIQSWIVDVPKGTAVLATQRQFQDADVVSSADLSTIWDDYATIETQASWDGKGETYMDAIDTQTGAVLASVLWEDGSRISIKKDGKTMDLTLPSGICKDKKDGDVVAVSGLEVNGAIVPVKHPTTVACMDDTFVGEMRPGDLGIPLYARSKQDGSETLEFSLPWGETASVNLGNLRAQGVVLEAE